MIFAVRNIDGEKVRVARERAFWSMSELAVEAGLDRNTVARIEKGRAVSVHPRTIRKLAEVLAVEPVALTPENE